MTIINNWWAVITRAWSFRLTALAVVLTGAEAAMPLLFGVLPIPQGTFAALSGLVGAAALYARVVRQEGLKDE